MTRDSEANQAKALLVNYFQAIAKRAGMTWDNDYTVEIEDAVDHIIEAASLQVRDELDNYVKRDALI